METTTLGKRFTEALNYLKENMIIKREKDVLEGTKYTPATISEIKRGGQKPSDSILENIKKYKINTEWIMTGKGEMLLSEATQSIRFNTEVRQVFDEYEEIPYIPARAQAGYLSTLNDHEPMELDTILVPKEFEKGNYLVIEIAGDSMDDGTKRSICEGDKILIKELDPLFYKNNKLHYQKYLYVIMHKEGIVLKEIIGHDIEKGILTLHSWNPDKTDYQISLQDVFKIFYYKKTVERRPML